jgi:hypothetical protein
VPAKLNVCGLVFASSVTVSVPVMLPVDVGVNETLMAHDPYAAIGVAQLLAEKPAEAVMLLMLSATDWLFVKVTVFAVLVVSMT